MCNAAREGDGYEQLWYRLRQDPIAILKYACLASQYVILLLCMRMFESSLQISCKTLLNSASRDLSLILQERAHAH